MSRGGGPSNNDIGQLSYKITAENATQPGLDAAKNAVDQAAQAAAKGTGESALNAEALAASLGNTAVQFGAVAVAAVGVATTITRIAEELNNAAIKAELLQVEFSKFSESAENRAAAAGMRNLEDQQRRELAAILRGGEDKNRVNEETNKKITEIETRNLLTRGLEAGKAYLGGYEQTTVPELERLQKQQSDKIDKATSAEVAAIQTAEQKKLDAVRKRLEEEAKSAEIAALEGREKAVAIYNRSLDDLNAREKADADKRNAELYERLRESARAEYDSTVERIKAKEDKEEEAARKKEEKENERRDKEEAKEKALADRIANYTAQAFAKAYAESAASASQSAGFKDLEVSLTRITDAMNVIVQQNQQLISRTGGAPQ